MPDKRNERIVFTGKQAVQLESAELAKPQPHEVRLETHTSLMSTGTENTVFNRNFDAGTHWDHWVKYPFYPGYALSGVVQCVGDDVDGLKEGDQVVARCQHQSNPVVGVDECYRLPEGIDMALAPWFALAKIALHGAMAARYAMGDRVVIIGAGPIGQMSLRWALASGVSSVVVVDPVKPREMFAMSGGATAYVAATVSQAKSEILDHLGGCAPDVVVDTTGHAVVFADALDLIRTRGTVVLLGDTGSPSSQALTSNFIGKGVSLVGAHDTNVIEGWDTARMVEYFFQLVVDGRLSLEALNTHCFVPTDCEKAYETANREREHTMGIVFNWNRSSSD